MSLNHLLPPPSKTFNEAKQMYMEQYGSALVTNTYLKIALLSVSIVAVGLIILNFRTYEIFKNFKPLVIRVNEVGRAEAVNYDSLRYKPQANEIRYFLTDFVNNYYGRVRATVRNNFARSLYFLDGRAADALIEQKKKSKEIQNFLVSSSEEIEILVTNVAIEDMRTPPYHATVDFEKVYYSIPEHVELRRERFVGNFFFVIKDQVPNAMVPINPLGLVITYFRQDQAFPEQGK